MKKNGFTKSIFEGVGGMLLDREYFCLEVVTEVIDGLKLYFFSDGREGGNEFRIAIDR